MKLPHVSIILTQQFTASRELLQAILKTPIKQLRIILVQVTMLIGILISAKVHLNQRTQNVKISPNQHTLTKLKMVQMEYANLSLMMLEAILILLAVR